MCTECSVHWSTANKEAAKQLLKSLHAKLYEPEYAEMQVVDFSNVAQSCNVYEEYIASAAETPEPEHTYYGVAIYGDKKKSTA